MKKTDNQFESLMERLKEVVNVLETGNISLDETLKLFEEGMRLVRDSKDQLLSAEERVSTLLKTEDGFKEKPGT